MRGSREHAHIPWVLRVLVLQEILQGGASNQGAEGQKAERNEVPAAVRAKSAEARAGLAAPSRPEGHDRATEGRRFPTDPGGREIAATSPVGKRRKPK